MTHPSLHDKSTQGVYEERDGTEPDDAVYRGVKTYLSSVSDNRVYPGDMSHEALSDRVKGAIQAEL